MNSLLLGLGIGFVGGIFLLAIAYLAFDFFKWFRRTRHILNRREQAIRKFDFVRELEDADVE